MAVGITMWVLYLAEPDRQPVLHRPEVLNGNAANDFCQQQAISVPNADDPALNLTGTRIAS